MKKILIFLFSILILTSKSLAFSDYSSFYWAKDAIDKWSSGGFISGYPDGTFRGNRFITRAEAISIINKINNYNENIDKRVAKDIKTSDWFFNEMGKAVKSGLISLDEDGNLRPNDFATREEVMVILSKLLNISYTGSLENAKVKNFSDYTKISSENYKRVAGIVEEGFVSGYSDNTLRSQDNVTRAEFICILNNSIQKIISSGEYNNLALVGNIVINGEGVKVTNSEIKGKVFVLDGAKNVAPTLINTKISGGINSRVGEILIKNVDELQTVTERDFKYPEDTHELAFARIVYSETDWTNEDVIATIKIDNDKYKIINGDNKITFERNGEKEVEYEYNGNIIRVKAKVSNIDKIAPKVTATAQGSGSTGTITLDIIDDGLSPITRIYCSNGITNVIDKETKEIENTITVTANGNYTVLVEDEAGNESEIKVKVEGLGEVQSETDTAVQETNNTAQEQN